MPYKDKERQRQYQRTWEQRQAIEIREYIREAKQGGCIACPEKDPVALDFHHINPKEKSFSIGRRSHRQPLEQVVIELGKCIILCANCHRKLHAGKIILCEVGRQE